MPLYRPNTRTQRPGLTRGPVFPATSAEFLAVTGLSPAAIWLHDETSGDLSDRTGNGFNLNPSQGPTYGEAGPPGGGLATRYYDSTTSRHQVTGSMSGLANLGPTDRVMLYGVFRSTGGVNRELMTKFASSGRGFGLRYNPAGTPVVVFWAGGGVPEAGAGGGETVTDNEWHACAAIWDEVSNLEFVVSERGMGGSNSIAALGSLDGSGSFSIGGSAAPSATSDCQFCYSSVVTGSQLSGYDVEALRRFMRNMGWSL